MADRLERWRVVAAHGFGRRVVAAYRGRVGWRWVAADRFARGSAVAAGRSAGSTRGSAVAADRFAWIAGGAAVAAGRGRVVLARWGRGWPHDGGPAAGLVGRIHSVR